MQPGVHAMRKTDEQKQASLEQRIAALREKVKRIEQRKSQQERRDRLHVGMIIGWGLIERARSNPKSEVRRVALDLIQTHLAEKPDDRPMAELLDMLKNRHVLAGVAEAAE
jgi:hypothetical protein